MKWDASTARTVNDVLFCIEVQKIKLASGLKNQLNYRQTMHTYIGKYPINDSPCYCDKKMLSRVL